MHKAYHPNKIKRKRTHGFLERKRTPQGRAVLRRRRRKGRRTLSA